MRRHQCVQDEKMEARAIESLVDRRFGVGSLERVKGAAIVEVAQRLGDRRFLDAGFSAAHLLVFGEAPSWSEQDQDRMVAAWQAAFEEDRAQARLDKAGWRCAYLRMLGEEVPADVRLVMEALRVELRGRLEAVIPAVSTAGIAVDLLLVNGEWVPNETQTARLLEQVEIDGRTLVGSADDLVMGADRIALWLLIVRAGSSLPRS